MIDIQRIRENPKAVEENLRKRNEVEKIEWVKEIHFKDEKYRHLLQEDQSQRKKRNDLIKKIEQLKKEKKDEEAAIKMKHAKHLMQRIKEMELEANALKEQIHKKMMRLPNLLHESVPIGKDASENQTVQEFGKKPEFDFKPKNHVQLLEKLGLADLPRAAKISQARFYFLKGELALMDFALMNYAIDFLRKKGFTFLIPPYAMNRAAYEGVTDLQDFEEVMYKIEDEDLYLIATAEHPMIAMHAGEVFEVKDLPKKYAGFSPCFRKEAGAHGIAERGIWRVHQFHKIEQIIFSHPNDSWQLFEELTKNTEEFFESLELPFRKVNVCTGDIGSVAAKKYDLEAWIPSTQKFMEIASCSNCTDYQANRLKIRFRTNEGNKAVHTLNATCVATSRALAAIFENNQTKDGTIKVPKVLQKYLNGLKEIRSSKGVRRRTA